MNSEKKSKIYKMSTYAIMAALMCIFGPMSVPIGPIPVSLTNLILYFSIFIIGTKGTCISFIIYLLLGMVGLPVFSGFQGGIGKLAGPTGGYLVGFIFVGLIGGIAYEKSKGKANIPITFLGMIIGTAILYLFGTVWFIKQMDCDFAYALGVCVYPFIPFDLAKMVIATILGRAVRQPLVKQGLIQP